MTNPLALGDTVRCLSGLERDMTVTKVDVNGEPFGIAAPMIEVAWMEGGETKTSHLLADSVVVVR